jgi:hypothetical protein
MSAARPDRACYDRFVSRRTTRRPARKDERNRPSTFFLIALAVGIALLIWMVVHMIGAPPPQQPHRAQAAMVLVHVRGAQGPVWSHGCRQSRSSFAIAT